MKSTILIFLMLASLSTMNSRVFNFDEALSLARENHQKVLMVFAGSDWCIPCKKFEKTILETPEFKEFEEKNLVVLFLDFPARKKNQLPETQKLHNEMLAKKYNPSGVFPTILLLAPDGGLLKEIKFKNQKTSEFIAEITMAQQ